MAISNIEWTDLTWNPTTGCTKISAGCKNCYAETMSRRLKALGKPKYARGFELATHEYELNTPYKWRGDKRVFVNSMSDLFHEEVSLSFIQKVFDVMNNTPNHVYQVLTKRTERLKAVSKELNWAPNIWIGTSVENEENKYRIDDLINIPAVIRFLSIEPLIGPVQNLNLDKINWVIVGGESGPRTRPIKKVWVEYIQKRCNEEKVPFFFKQWGKAKYNENYNDPTLNKNHADYAKGGCLLNGEVYKRYPLFI